MQAGPWWVIRLALQAHGPGCEARSALARSELFSGPGGRHWAFWIRASARRLAVAGLVCAGPCPRGPLVRAGVRLSRVGSVFVGHRD